MTEILKAPGVQHYIDWLHRSGNGAFNKGVTYDEKSYPLINEIYKELQKIVPMGDRNLRELWLRADRGTIGALGDMKELLEYGDFDSEAAVEAYWKDMYPDDEYWYFMQSIEDENTGYRAIFLAHKFVVEVDPRKEQDTFPHDISEFMEWMLSEVKRCVAELEAGTYNDYVRNNLPACHRTGTIVRKELYDIFPDERKEFFEDLCEDDREAFIKLATSETPQHRLKNMTANDFYRFCSYGYAANQYEGCQMSPRDQYDKHADGRDEGLGEIDPDSPEAFLQWLTNRDRRGGHPWEVCAGGNSTHIDLFVRHDADGYYLVLAGSSWGRTIETVKFYLALHRKGLPVCVREAKTLVERMQETEKIGIVPEGVYPVYCEGRFPDEHIITFQNLPSENQEEVAKHCVWQEIREVTLLSE